MKKLITLFLLLSFVLSGCSLFVKEEDTKVYEELKNYYHQYVNFDIALTERFHEYLNNLALYVNKSSVRIRIETVTSEDSVMINTSGSGVIFHESNEHYYVLTSKALIQNPNHVFKYQVIDYAGNTYTGTLFHFSETLGMIRINKDSSKLLPIIKIAKLAPFINEPIVLLSYRKQIVNSITLGLVDQQSENDTHHLYTNISSDRFANGGAILNMASELVGIQFMLIEGLSVAYDSTEIHAYQLSFIQFLDEQEALENNVVS